jgi:hypothetical protein
MGDLFHRRANERRQAFPFRLPNDAQPATKISRRIHGRIIRERTADFREPMIERKVMTSHFRVTAVHAQDFAALFRVDWLVADCPYKSITGLPPMKNLAGAERDRQIEIRR